MLLTLLACNGDAGFNTLAHADLVMSTDTLDFGEVELGTAETAIFTIQNGGDVPLGLGSVSIDGGNVEHWTVTPDEVDCAVEGVLQPACVQSFTVTLEALDLGEIWGAVAIVTATTEGDQVLERGNADLDSAVGYIELHALSTLHQGRINLSPRAVDFGAVWPGDHASESIAVENTGDAALALYTPVPEGCSEEFSFQESWQFGDELAAGATAWVEVTYTPEDFDGSTCSMVVASDDAGFPGLDVYLQGNRSLPTNNTPPTVTILSPEPLDLIPGSSLEVQIEIGDAQQPPSSLQCTITSANLLNTTLASCRPTDDTGVVTVQVATNGFPDGTDTLQVIALDNLGDIGMATIPLLMDIDRPSDDADGDGYGAADCDDGRIDTYPHALELQDGVDNDCDDRIDEGTDGYDDDLDAFTEDEGDCNDANADSYPGATEVVDNEDNDCNDVVDDNTNVFDDDGDGAALDDCNDEDPEVFPNATEWCNDVDDDCNGQVDDDCIELSAKPLLVTGVLANPSAVTTGGSSTVSMGVVDDQALSWSWSATDGVFADATAEAATWTAGAELGEVTVTGRATDPDGNEVWAFALITVVDDGELDGFTQADDSEEGGCSTAPASAGLALALLAAVCRRR